MKKIALFPGSFDPFTKGHQDIVLRGARLFDEVVIGIGNNSSKQRYFPIDYMLSKIQDTFVNENNIKVEIFQGLTSQYAKSIGASHILRGLRNTTDYEYENTIAQVNNFLNDDLETVFLITTPALAYISSSIVREIHKFDGDVRSFLPYPL